MISKSCSILAVLYCLTYVGTVRAQNLDFAIWPTSSGSRFSGGNPNWFSGKAVNKAGDINNDGFADLIIGAGVTDNGLYSNAGVVDIVFGRAGTGLDFDLNSLNSNNSDGFRITINHNDATLGLAVSTAGDFNGDGCSDTMLGSALGAAWVIFGKPSLNNNINLSTFSASSTTGFKISSADPSDGTGVYLSYAGDVNNDGKGDILVSSHQTNNRSRGTCTLLLGKSAGIQDVNLDTFTFSDATGFKMTDYGEFGMTAAPAGDFNNDGFDDFLVGRYNAVYLVFGKASGFTDLHFESLPTPSGTVRLDGNYSRANGAAAGDGDFNGDGFSDLVLGAYGTVRIVYGRAAISSPYNFTVTDNAGSDGLRIDGLPNTGFASAVDYAGDVNSDGFDDLLITAPGADPLNRGSSGSTYLIYGRAQTSQTLSLATNFVYDVDGFRMDAAPDHLLSPTPSGVGDFNNDGFDDLIIHQAKNSEIGKPVGVTNMVMGKTKASSSVSDWRLWD